MTALTPTLETCQKLKELGFPQKTIKLDWGQYKDKKPRIVKTPDWDNEKLFCAAPTFQEIWNELPRKIDVGIFRYWKTVDCSGGIGVGDGETNSVSYRFDYSEPELRTIFGINLAQAAAELWIWCKQNNYIK